MNDYLNFYFFIDVLEHSDIPYGLCYLFNDFSSVFSSSIYRQPETGGSTVTLEKD